MSSRRKKNVSPDGEDSTKVHKTAARSDFPAYFRVGSVVSARYKGAYCTAKVKKVVRTVRVRVNFHISGMRTKVVAEENIKGSLIAGNVIQAKLHSNDVFRKATVVQVLDKSVYIVVFNDGDISRVRRSQIVAQGARHFPEGDSLDSFPLFHPELFGAPVQPVQISAPVSSSGAEGSSETSTSASVAMDDSSTGESSTAPTAEPMVVVPTRWAVAGGPRRLLGASNRRSSIAPKREPAKSHTENGLSGDNESQGRTSRPRAVRKRRRRRCVLSRRTCNKKSTKKNTEAETKVAPKEIPSAEVPTKQETSWPDASDTGNKDLLTSTRPAPSHVHNLGYPFIYIKPVKSEASEAALEGCRKRKAFLPMKVVKLRRSPNPDVAAPLIDLTDDSFPTGFQIEDCGSSHREDNTESADHRSPSTSSDSVAEGEEVESKATVKVEPIRKEEPRNNMLMLKELSKIVSKKNIPVSPEPPCGKNFNFTPNLDGVSDPAKRRHTIESAMKELLLAYFTCLDKLKNMKDPSSLS